VQNGSTGVVRVNQPLDREDTRLYTLVSSHMKSSLKGTRAEGVHGGCQGQPAPRQGGHQALHSYTVKKASSFPVPMPLTKLTKVFPPKESLFSGIPVGDGKMANLFLQCT
jgi:hypothetical protein